MTQPLGITDCHVHIFEPTRHPYQQRRSYTPGRAGVLALHNHLHRVGADRVVLVQPSVYGSDNSAMLGALKELGPSMARGVAVIDLTTTEEELEILAATGVRGLRLNVSADPQRTPLNFADELRALLNRTAPSSLLVEIFAAPSVLAEAAQVISESPVPVLLDHFGGVRATPTGTLEGAETVLDLYAQPQVWVKLSAPYRVGQEHEVTDLLPSFVQTLTSVSHERLVWASDWPHTGGGQDRAIRNLAQVEPFRKYDAAASVRQVSEWIAAPEAIKAIFKENAKSLYGFPQD
ncbi:amidohydrolase family protein [Rothia sp. AR01]|uniref:Amidohydrolase family protein n=1 Tax=Rothia santali TaxID=2949643 RepID=A0A9X2HB32_9MICC|nr:amidohydrolase family protein [Rothia santali]MCP3426359.1 amidohydrolase family protein [Rothia santali]